MYRSWNSIALVPIGFTVICLLLIGWSMQSPSTSKWKKDYDVLDNYRQAFPEASYSGEYREKEVMDALVMHLYIKGGILIRLYKFSTWADVSAAMRKYDFLSARNGMVAIECIDKSIVERFKNFELKG